MGIEMDHIDKDVIVEILAEVAATTPAGSDAFFRDLVLRTTLPKNFKFQLVNSWKQDPYMDARNLLEYALARPINSEKPNMTTLGSLLEPLVRSMPVDLLAKKKIAVIIIAYGLTTNRDLQIELATRYKIPLPATGAAKEFDELSIPLTAGAGPVAVGPDIAWLGDDPDRMLQAWPWAKIDYLDVGFLKRATARSESVCRVEIPDLKRTGTGFLIAPDLLITNYHVLKYKEDEDINRNAAITTLRFGYVTEAGGANAAGQTFTLNKDNPIEASSPVKELDFVLLRVERAVRTAEGVKPLSYQKSRAEDKSLNIIQHPEGDTMKIALSANGVSGVYETGLIQYVSKTAGGSSGSPCFNDDWELVALHHAERSRVFGSIREGIQFSSIYPKIENIVKQ